MIQLRRGVGKNRTVDLHSFKDLGNLDDNPYLLDNDVIFVPLRERVVQIDGTVKKPAVYELRNERSLEDAIRLAGGMTPGSVNPAPIKVIRYNGEKKEIINVENKEEARRGYQLKNGDVIVVPHFLSMKKRFDYNLASLPGDNQLFYPSFDERVFILGAVLKPGPVPYNTYFNVGQYLTLAGGMTKLAKRHSIKIISSQGVRTRAKLDTTEIGPGDAIIVPERYMPPESLLSLTLGLAASVLGITTTVLTLTR